MCDDICIHIRVRVQRARLELVRWFCVYRGGDADVDINNIIIMLVISRHSSIIIILLMDLVISRRSSSVSPIRIIGACIDSIYSVASPR